MPRLSRRRNVVPRDVIAHVSPFFTQIVTGLIILAAIWLNTRLFAGMARLGRR